MRSVASAPGRILVLNGAPRSGKSSIVAVIQDTFGGAPWMNLGVDVVGSATPPRFRPGIGLRPGVAGVDRPEVERLLPVMFAALYDSVAAHSRHGLNVVVDIGHHDDYTTPLGLLGDAAHRLDGLPAWLIGVRCDLDVVAERRAATGYLAREADGTVAAPVVRWHEAVHEPGIYDLEVDTSTSTPAECAAVIADHLDRGPAPTAFRRLSAR